MGVGCNSISPELCKLDLKRNLCNRLGLFRDFDHGTRVGHLMTDLIRGSGGGPTGDLKEPEPVGSGPRLGRHPDPSVLWA